MIGARISRAGSPTSGAAGRAGQGPGRRVPRRKGVSPGCAERRPRHTARVRVAARLRGRPRGAAAAAILLLLLAGCAAPGAGGRPERGEPESPASQRQTLEELRREVAGLRAELESQRRTVVMRQELLGLRQELEAVHTAVQAVIRDLEQRQLEGSQTVDRRLAALSARVDELATRLRRAEAAVAEPGPRPAPSTRSPSGAGSEPVTEPRSTAPPEAGASPPGSPPADAVEPPASAKPREHARTIQRVTVTEAPGETRVRVEADGTLTPRISALADPPRVLVDLENVTLAFSRAPRAVEGPLVERIRFIQLRNAPSPAIRLVLTLKRAVSYWVESQPRGLVLHLGRAAAR